MTLRSPYALAVGAATLWALLGVWATELLQAGLAPVEIAFWRAAVGGGAFVIHVAVRRRPPDRRDLPPNVALGLVGVALFYTALPAAIEAGGIAVAWVLLYTAPAFVIVAGWLLGRQRLDTASLSMVAVALVGVTLVAGGSGAELSAAALGWGLVAGATYSLHYLVVGWARSPADVVGRYAVALPLGAVALLPFVTFAPRSSTDWLLIGAIGLLSTYLPFLAIGIAIDRAEPQRVALVATTEPVLAVLIGLIAYSDAVTAPQLVGGALVLAVAASAAGLGDLLRSAPQPRGKEPR